MIHDVDQARDLDKRLNAATDPAEMSRLITRRRLIRAGMSFERALEQFERETPVRPIIESFHRI